MAKKIKGLMRIDTTQIIENLQQKLQEFCDTKQRWNMSEFRESWNKKNNEKIQELIKIQDRMICRFNKYSITIKVNFMVL